MSLSARVRRWADSAVIAAAEENVANIERLLSGVSATSIVDLGCDDGSLTVRLAKIVGATDMHGVEVVEERAKLASRRGVVVRVADLNEPFPYDDAVFDLVFSNQVIEHVHDTSLFVHELSRVLRPSGHAVISTENLASWHNIASLVFGWQPFSLTNVSHSYGGLGNPLATHRGKSFPWLSWEHVRVFAYRGLLDLFNAHALSVEEVVGAGYYPLPARIGRWDPRHAAFLSVKLRK